VSNDSISLLIGAVEELAKRANHLKRLVENDNSRYLAWEDEIIALDEALTMTSKVVGAVQARERLAQATRETQARGGN